LSIRGEKRAFTLFLLIVLLVVPAYAYYDHQTRPATGAWSMVGDLQFRATSVQATGLGFGGPDLQLTVVVNNPNGFGVSLTSANYSIYADGRHLLDGANSPIDANARLPHQHRLGVDIPDPRGLHLDGGERGLGGQRHG